MLASGVEKVLSTKARAAGRGKDSLAGFAIRQLWPALGISLDEVRDRRFFTAPWETLAKVLELAQVVADPNHVGREIRRLERPNGH